jgi:hypothetical protein
MGPYLKYLILYYIILISKLQWLIDSLNRGEPRVHPEMEFQLFKRIKPGDHKDRPYFLLLDGGFRFTSP